MDIIWIQNLIDRIVIIQFIQKIIVLILFYVTAEPDNENAKVEGLGKVTISEEQRLINVTVTAENGNVKVYTINVENETNEQKKSTANGSIKWIIIITIMVIIICIGAIIIKKNHKDS